MSAKLRTSPFSLIQFALLLLAVLGGLSNFEGVLQLIERVTSVKIAPPMPLWVVYGVLAAYLATLAWRWYLSCRDEPLRQIARASASQAHQHLDILLSDVGRALQSCGEIARLAAVALDDLRAMVDRYWLSFEMHIEGRRGTAFLSPVTGQRRFVEFLNVYELAVYRLRDAVQAASYPLQEHGNYREWKRIDTQLLSAVKSLSCRSSFATLRKELESSVWRDGVRHYL